jgi:hypothetical protein
MPFSRISPPCLVRVSLVRALEARGDLLLERGELLQQRPQQSALALDPRPETGQQRPAVAGAQPPQTLPPVLPDRMEVTDPLGHQQTLDPVHVPDPSRHQALALAGLVAHVLLLAARHVHHAADLALAAAERHQRAQQALDVDPVGLGPPRLAVDQDAGRIDHVVVDAALAQKPVQPEAVKPRLVAAHDPHRPPERRSGAPARLFEQLEQPLRVAARDPLQADLVAVGRLKPDQPDRLAQFHGGEQCGRLSLGGGRRRHFGDE